MTTHRRRVWEHLQPRTMGDPCSICGGVDYYCASMVDLILGEHRHAIWEALAKVYEVYSADAEDVDQDSFGRALGNLMDAWDKMVGKENQP